VRACLCVASRQAAGLVAAGSRAAGRHGSSKQGGEREAGGAQAGHHAQAISSYVTPPWCPRPPPLFGLVSRTPSRACVRTRFEVCIERLHSVCKSVSGTRVCDYGKREKEGGQLIKLRVARVESDNNSDVSYKHSYATSQNKIHIVSLTNLRPPLCPTSVWGFSVTEAFQF